MSSVYRYIKICGLTSVEDARAAQALGADLLGLVMHPKSPRFCDPAQARQIIDEINFKPVVLVFADNDADYARDLVGNLHGSMVFVQAPCESRLYAWLCENYPAEKILPVLSVSAFEKKAGGSGAGPLGDLVKLEKHPWIILDTGGVVSTTGEALYGGTGKTFDWNIVKDLKRKYFLAGGLNPGNISEALQVAQAPGFDVSSGIESAPGKKDVEKMAGFIRTIRGARAIGADRLTGEGFI